MAKKKASTILATTDIPQTTEQLACDKGEMCATGVLLTAMGYPLKELIEEELYPSSVFSKIDKEQYACDTYIADHDTEAGKKFWEDIEKRYGLDQETWNQIITQNDDGDTFKEIADWLKVLGY